MDESNAPNIERSMSQVKVLMVDDDADFALAVQRSLEQSTDAEFLFQMSGSFKNAMEMSAKFHPDVIFLDLNLPDKQGLFTFTEIHARLQKIPIVIISALDDSKLALEAVREGAQDYVLKGAIDSSIFPRIALMAVERQQILQDLSELSTYDELTKLYNRRGFMTFGAEYLKLSKRTGRDLTILYVDLDGLKTINDTYGHASGDFALIKTAGVLRQTFRDSDIIARIGSDEFAVIAVEAPKSSAGMLTERLLRTVDDCNRKSQLPFKISVSVGSSSFDSDKLFSIDQLMALADLELYHQKKRKQNKTESERLPLPE
ncbi:MAG: GGDEF domain-containing response regulator [Candidatus Omnitrophica bacterium]|nr:GGDEF domain-containing response regulator [Candidatus Omnitrophota bacterium]